MRHVYHAALIGLWLCFGAGSGVALHQFGHSHHPATWIEDVGYGALFGPMLFTGKAGYKLTIWALLPTNPPAE